MEENRTTMCSVIFKFLFFKFFSVVVVLPPSKKQFSHFSRASHQLADDDEAEVERTKHVEAKYLDMLLTRWMRSILL